MNMKSTQRLAEAAPVVGMVLCSCIIGALIAGAVGAVVSGVALGLMGAAMLRSQWRQTPPLWFATARALVIALIVQGILALGVLLASV